MFFWHILFIAVAHFALLGTLRAQDKFTVDGTLIPKKLLETNYGRMPKGIVAYDLTICNSTPDKQSVTSSQIYQALSVSNQGLRPIGRQVMLVSILQNQNRSWFNILSATLNSGVSVFSILSTSRVVSVPGSAGLATAVAAIALQRVAPDIKSLTAPADRVEKFDREVLEPALVLDGGSCVERLVFGAAEEKQSAKHLGLRFHVK